MTIRLVRVFFVILSVVCGYYLGSLLGNLSAQAAAFGAITGLVAALALILMEVKLQHVSLRNLSAAAFGLVFGFLMAWIVTLIVRLIPMDEVVYSGIQIVFTLVFSYLGMIISLKGKDEFNLIIPYVRFTREDQREQLFLLDTSVIIDGRIAGICETGFLSGKLVIPRFVLHELQQVADSPDDAKRNRGRRGLDMLNRLKKTEGIEVIIHDENLSEIKGVDAKLVRLGKMLGCNVLTNDFNLNKVAKIEGVKVLNINDLADALKPVVFPGEQMNVYIRKEGKERNQGVAFLDDGTMIVVDDARKLIGKSANIIISSVLQTSAGRMIFATLIERPDRNDRMEERPQGRRDERQPRQERERPERQDMSERQDRRDDYQPRPERPEWQDRSERPERQDMPERQDHHGDQDRQQGRRDDRSHRGRRDRNWDRRPHRQDRPAQQYQGQRDAQPRADQPQQQEQHEQHQAPQVEAVQQHNAEQLHHDVQHPQQDQHQHPPAQHPPADEHQHPQQHQHQAPPQQEPPPAEESTEKKEEGGEQQGQ